MSDLKTDTETDELSDAALIEEARERFKLCLEAWADQREREIEDLEFQVPEKQWDPEAAKARRPSPGSPGSPVLSISKVDQPVQLVNNQMRAADLTINFHPTAPNATDETAKVLQGLHQHMERDCKAENARWWGFDRATKCGLGWYRMMAVYDPQGGHPTDQKLVLKRIRDGGAVYVDPSADEMDFSDAEYLFIVSWIPRKTFRREHPKAKAATDGAAQPMEWNGLQKEAPEWVRKDDVCEAEYWYKTHKLEKFKVEYQDGEETKAIEVKRDRISVHCAKITGWDVLERYDWPGHLIPIIPEIGRELQPFDGKRRWFGMIRTARDGQMLYNVAASELVKSLLIQNKAPYILAEGQDEGFKEMWRNANNKNYAYLVYKPTTVAGQLVGPPQRNQADSSYMQQTIGILQEADQFIQATTAVFDPSLGKLPQKERSGRAIQALQQQAEAGTSHFIQNLEDISLPYEGRCFMAAAPYIYDRPGRVARIVKSRDKKQTELVMLNAPFVMGPDGKPMPAPKTMPQDQALNYNLAEAEGGYDVAVAVGKSFQTKLEEGASEIGSILEADPQLMMLIGDLYFENRDFPGAKDIAERLSRAIDAAKPGLRDGKQGQPTPDQLQAQNAGLQQQLQAMGQQLQTMQMQLETDRAKQEAALLKTRMEIESKERIAAADNETKLAMAGFNSRADRVLAALEHASETAGRHEEMAHDVAMAGAGANTMRGVIERGQETGQEQGSEQSMGQGNEQTMGMPEPEPAEPGAPA